MSAASIPSVQSIALWRYGPNSMDEDNDYCVQEVPLEIRLRILSEAPAQAETHTWLCTMRTPGNDFGLVRGLLLTSGVIANLADIVALRELLDEKTQQPANIVVATLKNVVAEALTQTRHGMVVNSSCGVCGQHYIDTVYQQRREGRLTSQLNIKPDVIQHLLQTLTDKQSLFAQTGGSHGAGLFNAQGDIIDVQEDIGRHNAMDKLIGHNAQTLVNTTSPYGVVISSRASFEILQKAAMLHLQWVIAVGAPSSLAIELANELDITLIAFVREHGFNVYSGQHRLMSLGTNP